MSHVLIVDDDEDIRRIARLSLERIGGWQVTEAGSAVAALDATAAASFDAVLLDVMMPDVDGPTLLDRLRPRLGDAVPVVFLTAKVQPADVEALMARGAAGVIAKPFDPMGLPGELAGMLR
jgi:two-component system OmpR family response regulator